MIMTKKMKIQSTTWMASLSSTPEEQNRIRHLIEVKTNRVSWAKKRLTGLFLSSLPGETKVADVKSFVEKTADLIAQEWNKVITGETK